MQSPSEIQLDCDLAGAKAGRVNFYLGPNPPRPLRLLYVASITQTLTATAHLVGGEYLPAGRGPVLCLWNGGTDPEARARRVWRRVPHRRSSSVSRGPRGGDAIMRTARGSL